MLLSSLRTKVALVLVTGGLILIPAYLAKDTRGTAEPAMHLTLRTRAMPFKATGEWKEVSLQADIQARSKPIWLRHEWSQQNSGSCSIRGPNEP